MSKSEDRMNERIGLRRFEGNDQVFEACLFRNTVTLRGDGDAAPIKRECPDVDTARELWNNLLTTLRKRELVEVPARPSSQSRTVVLKKSGDRLSLKVVGPNLFEERDPPFPFPVPAPLYALFSFEDAKAFQDSMVASHVQRGFEIVEDREGTAAPVTATLLEPRKLEAPAVRLHKGSVIFDLAEQHSDAWSSLAELIDEFTQQPLARGIHTVELRADAQLDDHSLADALEVLGKSSIAKKLKGLRLAPADTEGRGLPLGDVSKAWVSLPAIESLQLDCSGPGKTKLGTLTFPRLKALEVRLSQPEHLRALLSLKAPRLKALSLHFEDRVTPERVREVWRFAGALKLDSLTLMGSFVPDLVPLITRSTWVKKLKRLELVSNNGLGTPMRWPALDAVKKALASVREVILRDDAEYGSTIFTQKARRKR